MREFLVYKYVCGSNDIGKTGLTSFSFFWIFNRGISINVQLFTGT